MQDHYNSARARILERTGGSDSWEIGCPGISIAHKYTKKDLVMYEFDAHYDHILQINVAPMGKDPRSGLGMCVDFELKLPANEHDIDNFLQELFMNIPELESILQ